MKRAGEVGVRNGERGAVNLQSRRKVIMSGEAGQKKFLRETLALFGVHNGH